MSDDDDDDDDGSPMGESTFMRCKVNPTPPASTAVHHVFLLLAILHHRPEVEASLEVGEEVPAFVAEAAPGPLHHGRPAAQLLIPARCLPHSSTASRTQETANGPCQK